MSGCTVDIMPVESQGPLEEGLRILARIVARDILAKRAMNGRVIKPQGGEDNGNLQNK